MIFTPRTASGYCRYSSDRQHESSIEAQELAIREWAARNDVKILRMYYDRALSGTTDNRPAFLQMIADLKTAPVDLVLVHKQDRFARNRYDAAIYTQEIKKRGARLVCVAQDFGEGNEAVLLESLMQGLAEYYSKNLSTEVIKGRRIKIKTGHHAGGTYPFGYTRSDDGAYKIVDLEAHYIRKLYDCVIKHTPYAEVVREMNAAGIKGRRGAQWKTSNISTMLRMPIYAGIYCARAGTETNEIENNHPAIIDPKTYQEAMRIMDARQNVGRRAATAYLLQKLVKCSCGSAMHGQTQHRKDKVYRNYLCGSHCGMRAISCNELDTAVCEYVNKLLSPELREKLVSALEEYSRGQHAASSKRAATNKQQIADLQKKIDALIENMSSGVLPPAVLQRMSDQITSYEEQIKVLEQFSAAPPRITRAQVELYFAEAASVSVDGDPEDTRNMLQRFIKSVTVYQDHFDIECTFDSYFQSLLNPQLDPDDDPHGSSRPSVSPRLRSIAGTVATSSSSSERKLSKNSLLPLAGSARRTARHAAQLRPGAGQRL